MKQTFIRNNYDLNKIKNTKKGENPDLNEICIALARKNCSCKLSKIKMYKEL